MVRRSHRRRDGVGGCSSFQGHAARITVRQWMPGPACCNALLAGAPRLPPIEHAQRSERVPATRRTYALQLEVRLTLVAVFQRPTAVRKLFVPNDLHGIGKAVVAAGVDGLKVIERPQDVVVPSRREGELNENRFDNLAGA